MFEGYKIIKVLRKLTNNNAQNISPQLIQDVEVSVKKNFYSVEEAAVMILSISISSGEIDRNKLTENGKELVDEYNKFNEIFEGNLPYKDEWYHEKTTPNQ